MKKILISLDDKILKDIEKYAKKMNFNRTQTIRYIIMMYLKDKV